MYCSRVLGHWQRRSAGHGRYIRDIHQPRRKSRGEEGGGGGREGGDGGEKEEDGGEKEEEEEEDLTLEDLLCARHCFDHF